MFSSVLIGSFLFYLLKITLLVIVAASFISSFNLSNINEFVPLQEAKHTKGTIGK